MEQQHTVGDVADLDPFNLPDGCNDGTGMFIIPSAHRQVPYLVLPLHLDNIDPSGIPLMFCDDIHDPGQSSRSVLDVESHGETVTDTGLDIAAVHKTVDRLMGCKTGSIDRKSTRLNSSHVAISYAVFC